MFLKRPHQKQHILEDRTRILVSIMEKITKGFLSPFLLHMALNKVNRDLVYQRPHLMASLRRQQDLPTAQRKTYTPNPNLIPLANHALSLLDKVGPFGTLGGKGSLIYKKKLGLLLNTLLLMGQEGLALEFIQQHYTLEASGFAIGPEEVTSLLNALAEKKVEVSVLKEVFGAVETPTIAMVNVFIKGCYMIGNKEEAINMYHLSLIH